MCKTGEVEATQFGNHFNVSSSTLEPTRCRKDLIKELTLVFFILVGFFSINYLTYQWYWVVWTDEVMHTDPAVNLYLGNGFVSTAWFSQTSDRFWAGNVPLHHLILAAYLNLFGFSMLSVRVFHYALMTLSGFVLWLGTYRLQLITSIWGRLALLALFFLGDNIFTIARTYRYDDLTVLLCLAAVSCFSVKSLRIRYISIFILAFLFPFAGLQLAAYAMLFIPVLLIFTRKAFLKESFVLTSGVAVGGISLVSLYYSQGVLQEFLSSIKGISNLVAGQGGEYAANAHVLYNKGPMARAKMSFLVLGQCHSLLLVFLLDVFLLTWLSLQRGWKALPLLRFCVVLSIFISVGLSLLGRPYAWMLYLPLIVATVATLEKLPREHKGQTVLRGITVTILLLACLVGAPLRLAICYLHRDQLDYAPIMALGEEAIRDGDYVYCDWSAYYAVKQRATLCFFPAYRPLLSSSDKERINLIIVAPSDMDEIRSIVGGVWQATPIQHLDQTPVSNLWFFKRYYGMLRSYNLQVYRRLN